MGEQRKNIAVFASGNGSNFSAIARAVSAGRLPARLALLVCDNPQAYVLTRARRAQVPVALIDRGQHLSRSSFEQEISGLMQEHAIDVIALAGFMRLLSADFVSEYRGRILNIHPSLLPSFKGTHGIRDTFEYGCKVAGVTVHFVDEHLDHGPIILQAAVPIRPRDTLPALEARIHRLEHRLYPEALRLFVEGLLQTDGRRVSVR